MAPFIQITLATTHDAPVLSALVNSAYRGNSSKKGWTTEAGLLDGIRTDETTLIKIMADPHSVILKCSDEKERLVGCVYLQKRQAKLYLGMLTVAPELQAKGIGKQLLAAAENHAKQTGCNGITMTVISVRKELIDWYVRHGYHPTGETQPFPTNQALGQPRQPLEFMVMEKNLF
jgi:predicted N-acetyltransferase YhbS